MDQVRVEDTPVSDVALGRKETVAVDQAFRMYMGETQTVTLEFIDSVIGTMFDKFGEGLKIERVGENRCRAQVTVQVSPTFWSWLFLYPVEIHLIEPKELTVEYARQLRDALNTAEAGIKD